MGTAGLGIPAMPAQLGGPASQGQAWQRWLGRGSDEGTVQPQSRQLFFLMIFYLCPEEVVKRLRFIET